MYKEKGVANGPSAKLRRDKIKQRIYIDILVIGIYSMRGFFGDRLSSRSMASSACAWAFQCHRGWKPGFAQGDPGSPRQQM